jgi:hypothetical protein
LIRERRRIFSGNHAAFTLSHEVARPDFELGFEFGKPSDTVGPEFVTHIESKILIASLRPAVPSPVIENNSVPGLHQSRPDVIPHLGAAETVVEQNQRLAFTVTFVINPQTVDGYIGHVNLNVG